MKRVFLLGVGVGFILSGILFYFVNESESSKTVSLNEITKEIEAKEKEELNNMIIEEVTANNTAEELYEKKIEEEEKLSQNETPELEKKEIENKEAIKEEKKSFEKKEQDKNTETKTVYVVQLGAFKDKKNADEILNKVSEFDLNLEEKNGIYRVLSEEYENRDDASKISNFILEKYRIKSYIKKIN